MKPTLERLGASVLLCALASGCAGSLESSVADASAPPMRDFPGAPMPAEQVPVAPAGGDGSSLGAKETAAKETGGSPDLDPKVMGEHLLIYVGTVGLQVDADKLDETLDAITDAAGELEGYVASQDAKSITVRVPSSRFRKAMRAMEKLGEVTQRTVKAEDVTEQYHDLGVRLTSLQATRDRLQGFLASAKNIEEVLRLEQELGRIAGEIDKIEGTMRFLQSQTSFSTITVSLEPKAKPVVIADPSKPPPPPPPHTVALPIEWLNGVGLEGLFQFDE